MKNSYCELNNHSIKIKNFACVGKKKKFEQKEVHILPTQKSKLLGKKQKNNMRPNLGFLVNHAHKQNQK